MRRAILPLMMAVLLFTGCGGASEDTSADAAKLLTEAAARMERVQRFHYLLEHENGTTAIVLGFQMSRAEGDVDGPERMRAAIRGMLGTLNLETGIVILGDQAWFQNPLNRRWEPQQISIDQVFDPQDGVVALMRRARSPRVAGTERIGDVEVRRVEATLDSADLTLLPGEPVPGKKVDVAAWVGVGDPLVHRIELRGAAAEAEPSDILRRITLTRFDEAVTIDPPR